MRSIVDGAIEFVSLLTNGNGACSLHAAFGDLGNGREFFCDAARPKAAAALRYFYESGVDGLFLRQKVLTGMWCELTKPVLMHQLGKGNAPAPHAREFWSRLPEALRTRYRAHTVALENAVAQNQTLRAQLVSLSRKLCTPEAADFLDALFAKLKEEYGNIGEYDVEGKLDAILDPDGGNDKLRVAFFCQRMMLREVWRKRSANL